MRLMIALLATLGLAANACGEKAAAPAEPTASTTTTAPTKAPAPTRAPEPAKSASAADAAAAPAVDRLAEITKALAAYSAGDYEQAFAAMADSVVWTELGNPLVEEPIRGKAALIQFHHGIERGMQHVAFKASRVVDMGVLVAVEATWSATAGVIENHQPVDKAVAVDCAFLLHYGADGKVDQAWSVFDAASLLTQLNLVPGTSRPAVLAETTELVKGPLDPANAELYKTHTEKLDATTVEAFFDAVAADDLARVDGSTGQTLQGKPANVAAMRKELGDMGAFTITVDELAGAGDWIVAVQTVSFTQGGMGDIPGEQRKVTLPTIAFARFEGGKMKRYRDYADNLGRLEQLGAVPGGAAPKPEGPATAP
ncbi:MAG: nuclear transport factor 2 family protein [Myxococcota bacterium]